MRIQHLSLNKVLEALNYSWMELYSRFAKGSQLPVVTAPHVYPVATGSGKSIVCKRFAVQILLWPLNFVTLSKSRARYSPSFKVSLKLKHLKKLSSYCQLSDDFDNILSILQCTCRKSFREQHCLKFSDGG